MTEMGKAGRRLMVIVPDRLSTLVAKGEVTEKNADVLQQFDLREHLGSPETHARRAYVGFDPTADSLTIGNLVPIMLLVHFQRAGGFQAAPDVRVPARSVLALAIGDAEGDGDLDVLGLSIRTVLPGGGANGLFVFPATAPRRVGFLGSATIGGVRTRFVLGDLDLDGSLDAATAFPALFPGGRFLPSQRAYFEEQERKLKANPPTGALGSAFPPSALWPND